MRYLTKLYKRFWPPERKRIKLLQVILDYETPNIDKKVRKAWAEHILYGKRLPPSGQ